MKRIRLFFVTAIHRPIFRLVLAQGISLVGSRCTTFALGIWLFQQTGKTTEILLIPFFQEVSGLLVNPFLGMIVYTFSRKKLMILADSMQALGSVFLALSISLNAFNITVLYAVVILQGLFASLQSLAADAMVAPLTREENRHRVNAVKQMLFPLAGIVAPPIAGLLFFRWGLVSVLAFDLASFLVSMVILALARIPRAGQAAPDEDEPARGSMEGFRYLKRHPRLLLFAVFFGILNFLWNGPLELITPYLIAADVGPSMISLSMSLMSIGVLTGAAFLAVKNVRNRSTALFALSVAWNGIWTFVFGMARAPFPMVAALFFLMMPLPVAGALFDTELQNCVPQQVQGRVFSIVYQISGGTAPLSFLLIGPLTDRVLTPMMREGSSGILYWMFGRGPQAEMGLMLSLSGFLIFAIALLFAVQQKARNGRSS